MPVGLCWTHKVLCCVNQLGPATEANKISKKLPFVKSKCTKKQKYFL